MNDQSLLDYLAHVQDIQQETNPVDLYLTVQWIRYYMRRRNRQPEILHPFYTLHNLQHFDKVVHNYVPILSIAQLIDPQKEHSLTYYEAFYLLAAAYFHDIGMITQDEDDEVERGRWG